MNITIISSSPREESVSVRLALFLEKTLKSSTSHQITFVDVRDWADEFSDSQYVYKKREDCPEKLRPLYDIIERTDAYLIVSPEYNGSYPYALKRMVDHFNKQTRKVFGVATASTGVFGGMKASLALQHYVVAMFGVLCPNMLITPKVAEKIDEQGNLIEESFGKSTATFLGEFLWLAEAVSEKK